MRALIWVLRAVDVRRRELATAITAGSITLLAALALTLTSGWLITRAWEMPPVLELSVAITAVRALGISRALFRYLDRLYSHRVALHALTRLRGKLYAALAQRTGIARGNAHVRLVSDADRITDALVRGIIPCGIALALTAATLVFTAVLSPSAALVMACAMSVTGIVIPALVARAARDIDTVQTHSALVEATDHTLVNRVEFAAQGADAELLDRAAAASQADTAARTRAGFPLELADALQTWATGLAAWGVTAVAALTYAGNPQWMGVLVLLPLAAFEAHGPLPKAIVSLREATLSAAAVRAYLSSPAIAESPRTSTRRVLAQDLHTLHGKRVWNLDVAPGERVAIRGASGSGKSQFLLTVAGLQPPAAGHVTCPESCLLSPEEGWIFATTVRENLRVAAPTAGDGMLEEVLQAVGFEFRLDHVLADGADSLSAGQRRRLLLARALCSDAQVLLLDEPTEHIDPADAERLLGMLLHAPLPGPFPERTVIIVTHAPQED